MTEKYISTLIQMTGEKHDIEIVKYGMCALVDAIRSIIIILILGYLYDNIFSSVLFLLFNFIGTSTLGGYHFKTRTRCLLGTILLWHTTLLFEPYICKYKKSIVIGIAIACVVLVAIFAPAEHVNKPLPFCKIKKLKILSIVFVLCITALLLILQISGRKTGILLINLLEIVISMIIGKGASLYVVKRKRCKDRCASC